MALRVVAGARQVLGAEAVGFELVLAPVTREHGVAEHAE
jgi:hypothetical protein